MKFHYDAPVGEGSFILRYHVSNIYKKDLKKMTEVTPKLEHSLGGTIERISKFLNRLMMHYIKWQVILIVYKILSKPMGQHFITGVTYEGVLTMSRWTRLQENSTNQCLLTLV